MIEGYVVGSDRSYDVGRPAPATITPAGRWRVETSGAPYDPTLNPNPNRNPATITARRQPVTASAVQLASQALANGLVLKAGSANTGTVYVGGSDLTAANGYPLAPGEAISFGVTNANAVYVMVSVLASDTVAWTGN